MVIKSHCNGKIWRSMLPKSTTGGCVDQNSGCNHLVSDNNGKQQEQK